MSSLEALRDRWNATGTDERLAIMLDLIEALDPQIEGEALQARLADDDPDAALGAAVLFATLAAVARVEELEELLGLAVAANAADLLLAEPAGHA